MKQLTLKKYTKENKTITSPMKLIVQPKQQIQKIIKHNCSMMPNNSEIQNNFNCFICLDLARDAVETQCCGQIICNVCFLSIKNKMNQCSYCRQFNVSAQPSFMARRMINGMRVDCENGCGESTLNSQKDRHLFICPKRKISCKMCKKSFELSQLPDHMNQKHQMNFLNLLVDYNEKKEEQNQKLESKMKKMSIKEFQRRVENSNGVMAEWGETGKYYCGQKVLKGKCGCCDGHCGSTNGENCDACMELDFSRFGLQPGYLINPTGKISKRIKNEYYCGVLINENHCQEGKQCQSCLRLTRSVNKLGRYSNLV